MKELIESLKKKAKCIFIAVDESVAREVAEGFHEAIAALESAEAQNAELRAEVERLRGMVPNCGTCADTKVVAADTVTQSCMCIEPYSCALCKGAGSYGVTAIKTCPDCALPVAPHD